MFDEEEIAPMAAKEKAKKKQKTKLKLATGKKQATSKKKQAVSRKKLATSKKQATSKKKQAVSKKKQAVSKKKQATSKNMIPAKKTDKKKLVIKGGIPKKRSAAHKAVTVKPVSKKSKSTDREPSRERSQTAESTVFSLQGLDERSGGQSGDLQGLSNVEGSDSESVVELLEEGNAFEAAVVAGVENAGNTNPREVRTHEVLEDDVPDEYLDRE